MIKFKYIAVAVVLFGTFLSSPSSAAEAYQDCELKPHRFEEIGLAFSFRECKKEPSMDFSLSVKNGQVVWNRSFEPYATDISDITILF